MGLHLWAADGGGAGGGGAAGGGVCADADGRRQDPAGLSELRLYWTLPFTAGATRAQSIGNEAAPLLAAQYGAEIQFDTQSQTPYFTYLDEAGQPHEVWFEDVRSAQAKFALLPEYGLLGLGYWNFMRPFTAGFSLQNYLFTASGVG